MQYDPLKMTALLCALALSTGCATVVNGTTQSIGVSSSPPGATQSIPH